MEGGGPHTRHPLRLRHLGWELQGEQRVGEGWGWQRFPTPNPNSIPIRLPEDGSGCRAEVWGTAGRYGVWGRPEVTGWGAL